MDRYIKQAANYEGTPVAYATHYDRYDEYHVIVRLSSGYYLDWVGGEYAEEPDEFDKEPFENLNWTKVG